MAKQLGKKMATIKRGYGIFAVFLLQFLALSIGQEQDPQSRTVEIRTFSIDEGQPPGTTVGVLPTRPGFTYTFSTDTPAIFRINSDNWSIVTDSTIDREELESDELVYVVLGLSSSGESNTYPIEVRITILDINDNSPSFPEPSINIFFSESARIGAQKILDTALDPDAGTNGITENYAIVSGNTDNLFRLVVTPNPSGAAAFLHVETVDRLDRETQDNYQLNVSAQDGGSPPRFGYLQVDITIFDANDNPPIFDQSEYDVSLNESTPSDTLVLRVQATDRDAGENAEIIYFLDELDDMFTIHPDTGEIRTLQPIDFDSSDVYTITVEAKDKGNPVQYGRAFVHFSVIDENDHAPTISFRFIPASAAHAAVDEEAEIGTIAAIASITDEDEGAFGQVFLRIASGNEQGHFQLAPFVTFYALQVAGKLDRERISRYNLTFIGQDFGSPPRITVKHMIIYVTDANDHEPEFSQEVYTATLSELIPVGSFVVSLSAIDLDTGLNAEIQYTITDGNELGWFDIDGNTGLVTTTAVLDRELVSDITLNITANDQGRIQHHAKTHLVITILDENDQTPLFTFTSYNITIPENAEPQREITIVSASDSDLGVNGTIFYRLEDHVSVDYPGTFSIDTTSGKIITLISFDREQISHYTVTVKAFDGGNPALSSTTQVNVRIMDVNDNYPEFYPINYYSDIQENKPVGTSVAKVNASDPDFGNNGKISYSIIQGNTNGKFAIDRTSGLVTTTVSLDREEVQSYELRVRAVDEGSPAKTSQIDARIHVSVADILDTPPTFGKPIYNFKIYENVDIGHEVGTVHASTRDPSSVITYAISSGDRSGVFQIDSVSGEILTAQNIDREEKSSYQLTVIANGGPVIGETVVNIEVLDLNDNAPQFPRDAVTINIVENWNVGHNVYKVVATDRDQGPNAEIVYQLIKNPGNLFSIDSSSGQITVGTSISDQTSTYFLQVSATDIGTPHRSSVLNITVQILDVNDHSPVFIQNEYVTEIVESVDLNTQFFQVTATDTDIGENGRITYSITSGNNDNRFGIFPDGSLYVKNALDRELVEVYTLTVSAFDNGVPQRSSSAQVVVNVQDANDNRPLFTNQTYYFYLQEELPSSSYVGKIIASDQDQGTNSELRFSLSTVQSDFTINALNGEVSSTRTFDREELIRNGISTMFELNAVVHDNGNIQLEDEAVIYIYITDINDNSPQFVSSLYTASISETAMINTPVVHAVAYDDDSGTNAEITYTITSGNDDNKFHISAVTGQITLNGAIDREIITEYTLTVNAEDKGIPDVRSTSTQIIITVLDENDNAPVFAQSARSVDVAESSQIGELITTVSASDEDLGQNALITYTISAGNLLETFHIDQDSGNLYLAKSLDYESKNYYELSITARDNGKSPLTDTIRFEIHVRDTNDNEPVFRSNAIVHQVTEGIGFGTKLVTVTATDTDSGVNGQLAYSIANQSPPGEHFTIDSASGEIFTAADIDREYLPNGVFEITVMATDQAIPVTSRKSATKIVTIIVKDVNDNAPVFISQNSATISESTNPGGVVTMVTAVDPDAERNGEVTYSLSTDYNGLFVISTSGIITVSRRLNSPPRTYTLTVTATDNGKTPKSSSFQLTVIVTSASSTGAPFTKFRYTASVFENEPIGRNVIAVSASYPGNTQAQIEYYITAIKTGNFEHGRKFIIDKDSGAITVGNELDREIGYTDFTVDVYAVDLGASTPQTTRTQVQITLLDRNDNAPQFEESTRNVEVPEDISINSLVATVSAQDPDEGSNALVSYSIVSGDDGKFYINEESGEVRTRSRLDRETIASYNLDVSASDGSQYSVMSLGVKLLDSNDSPPEFSKEVYSFTVFEDEDVGVSIAEVMATDPDEGTNGEVTYSILEDWGQNRFELDADTGVFTLVQPLDFEKVQYYLITVEATDHGSPPMSSNVKCYFNTLDINDNPPIFDPNEYDEITVYEDVAIGTIAITVTATDADSGPNGAILYEIVSGDDNGDFDILENGTIITAKELDREEKSFYSLKITATDQPLDESLQMQDEVQINIKIGDVNDNAPEFINDNVTEVSEDAESGVVVITVEAEDPDEGVNGLVEYSMDPVPGNVFFMNGGDIVVSGNLDRETVAQYILTVYAEDGGDPSLTSTMEVLVNILDINDNAPEFDPSSYTDNIMENTPPGKEFLQVSATDPDEGLNGTVEFSIINGNYDNDFDIDEDSGVISIVNVIDRERRSQYSLTVMAKDKGVPSQSSSTTVTINLIDVNDNIPEFTEEFMTGSIDENNANMPVFVRTCDAEDEDEGSNGRLTYEIVKVTSDPEILDIITPFVMTSGVAMQRVRTLEYDYFTIDSSTGDVYVTEVLDREEIARYYLVITAHDAGDPSLTGTGTLEIQVNDLNDNPPVFTQTEYSAKVEEEQDSGVSVITVTATDEDDGTNADINYSLDPDSAQNKFGINYLTGEILTTARLDREEQGLYTLLVIAQDNADDAADRLSSTATVYVVVQDINDHVPEFISAPYSAVIPDSTSAGTFVEAVTAIDNDIGTNAQIRYTKVRGNDMSKFSVDATSGVIQTLSTMNNQNSQYWLEIQAQDQGEGFHTTRANVTINFDAVEDFPTFLPTIVAFDLDEDTPVETVVTADISATSPKQGQEGAITYFLSGGNFNETFSIHQMTGHVSLAKSLDYEIIQVFYLWVEARDGSSPALSSFIKLTIDVGDINDNAPRFSESTYYGSVSEEQSAGVSVLTVTAIDRDSGDNGEFSYSLDSDGNINTAFEIDASSGKLETNTRLDRETVAFYTLTVYAIDRGSPPLTGTATVAVNVIDVNDNAPRFDYHPLASVFEHSDVGTFVLRVETTDLDEGMNAVTVYEFLDSPVNEFAIHNLTGIITVADDIDREEQDRHSILLLATDLWRSHSVTTTVQISVRDINDNEPEFNPSEYARDLPERLPEGSSVTTVYATDDDIEQNGEVYYTMKSWCEYFTVDTNSGDVVLEKEIEYQSPGGGAVDPNIYQCSVFAIDGGIPTLWSDTDVSLTIFDHNEYAPEFEQDSYKARVQEDAGIHDKVVQVIATDDYDEGDNAVVRYEISGGNGTSKFTIESDTGWVLVLQSVLGDAGTIYAIQVRAYDQGYVPKDAFTTVSIPISEINQNPPVFYPTLYSQSVDESVQLGFTVTQVTATDIDRGLNGQVRYSITSGDDNEEFAIGSENGIITVAKPLDYDTEPKEYNLIITANDLGVETMTSSARVEVILRDVNDNPPVFDTDYYSQNIPENSPSGTSVISVTATDKDEGSNAYIEYSIYGGDGQYFFSIFQHNGTIISQGNLNYENEKKSYNLEIRARHPIDISMYDTATVTIHITGVNEYNPEFVKHHYLFTVSEAANDGQVIGKISARDADHGEDGRIIYAFVGGSTNQGFAINDDTGEVYVSYSHGRLNRESSDRSLLLAIAKNRGIIEGFDVDEAEIYVNITDANDPPVFVPDFYEGSVWENATYGTYVLTVTAEDYDLKPADHTFTYNITGGNHNNAFMIARDSGEIHTANVLDREDIPFYNLTVAAIDQGSPSMTGYAEVNIDLLDVNDNGPMFYPEDTIGSVYENEQAYTSVMTLSAYDPDTPSNGPPFTYYLLDSQYSIRFNLDSTSGLLTTTLPLNREEISDYYLPVESRDSGVPQMTSTTTMHVIVVDVNDNESQPRTAVIYVNSLDGTFPGGSIGIARPLDPDVDDEFDCTIVDGDTNTFSIQPKCDLNSVLHSGVETYMLNISGHDGIHNTVYSDFQVDYHAFTNNSLDNSVTLKLASQDGDSLDVGTFLKNHYDDFYTSVSNKLSGTETLLIIDMYEVDSKLDLLVAVRQGSQDNHMTRSQLAGFFTTYKAAIERESGVNLAEIDYSPCDLQPCLHNGQCDDHAEIYVTYTISDSDPIIFVAPQSQRAFICTCAQEYYGDICQYEPDMCEDNECKNGATCRKDSQSYICECLPGYTGTKCETDIDECASNPCQHGDCEDQIDSYVCDCNEGYIGVNCQIELDPCNPQPCFNEGECIAQDTGFYCDCSFGERGEFCEFSSFSFTSLSYVQYPDISGPSSIITLQFATTSQNALLVYNHDSTKGSDSEFVALEIIDGQMWFSHNSGAGVTRLSTTQMVSDGQWHEVIARRERTMESKLMIDQCDENIPGDYCRAETTSQGYNQLDLDGEPLHLGGVKSIESITLRPGQVSTSDFVGCMRDVYINGQFYDLTQPLDIMGVEAKCPRDVTLCESSPCQNGGTCVDDWWTYHCECLDGFMGHYCESEMSSFTFGGDSFVKYKIKDSFRREKALEGNLRRKKRATDTQTTSLSFRTRHHNGLLFYSADTDQLFTILEIKEKHVKYTFSSGNLGNASIILDGVDASDGHWQNVTLTKDGYTITLNLNGKNSKSETFSIPPHDFISITVQDLFVGGTEDPLSYKGQVIPGLDGCIDTFMLNDEVMPFVGENNMVIAEPYDGGGGGGSAGGCDGSDVCASNPCPDGEVCLDEWESYSCVPIGLCQPDPCQNNGTCVPGKDGNSYTCECVNDYSGDHCEIIPECYEDPCNEDEECISDGSGGHVCSPLVGGGGGGGDTNITLIIVFIVLALVVILFVVICLVYVRKRRKRKPEDKTKDQAVVDLDGVGEVNEAFTGENLKSNSPTNSEKARLGILGKQPDIIENEQKKRNINLDADTTITEGEIITPGLQMEEVEHYDLENASSIAPSDIDVTYHYRGYRDGRQQYNRNIHKHRMSPSHFAQARQSPLAPLYTPGARQSPLHHTSRQSPNPLRGQSPHSHLNMFSRTSPIKELSHSRTNSDQSINHSELRSEPGFRSNVSTASEASRRTKSPNGHLPNSRPSSRLKSPLTVGTDLDSEQPVGLSVEEVAMLNSSRPNEHAGSLPSTLEDGFSTSSSDHPRGRRVPFPNQENLLEPPESSTDESNDSFTCSEFEVDREKLKFTEFDPSKMIFSKLAEVNEDDTDLPDTSRIYNYVGIDSGDGSLSTLPMSGDEFPHVAVKPPNGHFSWDYLLNWGPSFENLVGVFKDIALLQDANITMKLEADPNLNLEEYV